MKLAGKILCKTTGAIGTYIALKDAVKTSGLYKDIIAEEVEGDFYEKAYFNSRTINDVSYLSNKIRGQVFDLKTSTGLPAIYGKCKGAVRGFLYGLGNSLPILICSTMALLCKNFFAKIGAIGMGVIMAIKYIREGFGIGKPNPMD